MQKNYFSFLRFFKSWKVVRIRVQKINLKFEQNPELLITINKRELQPIVNIGNLIKLGVKIVGPVAITGSENLQVINAEDIAKMELMIPEVHYETGKVISFIKTTFQKIKFEDCSARVDKVSDWFCAYGNDEGVKDHVVNGIVKNLLELEAYSKGSRFILE
ncbi:MAG: hypothetical protein WCH65_08865 [bacterium]